MVGAICTFCRPSRILLGSGRDLLVVCAAMPEPMTRSALERTAMRAHATISVGEASNAPATDDTIHVVTALALAPDLEAFITYDQRQAAAAVAAGLKVEAPGRDPA